MNIDIKTLLEEKSNVVKALETILSPLAENEIEKILTQTELNTDEIKIITLLLSLHNKLIEKNIKLTFVHNIIKNYLSAKISFKRKSRNEAVNMLKELEIKEENEILT